VWEALGCSVEERSNCIEIVSKTGRFEGADIVFPITTVGGTENALLCASVANGVTRIYNAYITPEVENLIQMLRLMGADITLNGASTIIVQGKPELHGVTVGVISDRIEALTWIVYAALSGGMLIIEDVPFSQMEIPLKHLRDAGINYFKNDSSIYVSPDCFSDYYIQPFEVACGTHPGIISDMQTFYVLLAISAAGRSLIVDYRYPKRVAFLEQLAKFLPERTLDWQSGDAAIIRVNGPAKLNSAEVKSTDLRGSMTLVLAALLADGKSVVHDVGMALRGYNNLESKLKSLGIQFEVVEV
jgi:UDP-N-acetylglucosamine 1-carboxyvinyltransferase